MASRESKTSNTKSRRGSRDLPAGSAFKDVTASRHGAPPLRFKGAELARHECVRPDVSALVTLWKSKTRGFVASVESSRTHDSASRSSIEELMSWLEQLCQPCPAPTQQTSVPQIPGFAEIARDRQILRIVAGEALDKWDLLTDAQTGRD